MYRRILRFLIGNEEIWSTGTGALHFPAALSVILMYDDYKVEKSGMPCDLLAAQLQKSDLSCSALSLVQSHSVLLIQPTTYAFIHRRIVYDQPIWRGVVLSVGDDRDGRTV